MDIEDDGEKVLALADKFLAGDKIDFRGFVALAKKVLHRAWKVPPHDLDAEAAVISTLLLEPGSVRKVRHILPDPKMCYSDANGLIVAACYAMNDAGDPIDTVTVSKWLRARELLARAGGSTYLAKVADGTPSIGHVSKHAQIVHEKWKLRQLIASCHRITAEAYTGVPEVRPFLNEAATTIRCVCMTSGGIQGRSGVQIMEDVYADVMSEEPEDVEGLYTGIFHLDKINGVMRPGSVTTVLAYSSHGKSAFCACVVEAALGLGSGRARCEMCGARPPCPWRKAYIQNTEPDPDPRCPDCSDPLRGGKAGVIVFSGEMRDRDYGRRMVQIRSGVNLRDLKQGRVTDEQRSMVTAAIAELSLEGLWIDDRTIDVAGIHAVVEAKKQEWAEQGIDLVGVIIDYAQRIKVKGFRGQRREELAVAGASIKAMAISCSCAVLLPAQLNEEARKKGLPPNAENVREAQDIVMDSDNCIIIYAPCRDESVNADLTQARVRKPEPVQFRLGKGRDGERGNVRGAFLPWVTKFTHWDPAFGEYELPAERKKDERD